jgi:RNA polymerase sigma-70 factor (ECF subfamily)
MRLRDHHDDQAWVEFVDIYAPLIHAYCLKHSLQDADAADIAQEVLASVASHAGSFSYDPLKGSFRGWLFTITRNRLRNELAKKSGKACAEGGTEIRQRLSELPDDNLDEEIWNREHQRRMFHWAATRVRNEFQPATWSAFWKAAVDGEAAAAVARELNLSVGAVYIAKSRVLARIRDEVARIEDSD